MIILSSALTYSCSFKQLDVNNAFLNDFLGEEVFIEKPKGFEISNPTLACRFNKATYGLKQAHR